MFTINDDDGEPGIRYMKVGDNNCIELCHCSKNNLENNLNVRRFSHICFEVDNIDELIDKVEKNNVPFCIEPKVVKDGGVTNQLKKGRGLFQKKILIKEAITVS